MDVDDVSFLVIELGILALALRAVVYEITVKLRHDGLNKNVIRGEQSWQIFFTAWGITSLLVTQPLSAYQYLASEGLSVTVVSLDIVLLYLLCFRSDWFRNWIMGQWGRLKRLSEDH